MLFEKPGGDNIGSLISLPNLSHKNLYNTLANIERNCTWALLKELINRSNVIISIVTLDK